MLKFTLIVLSLLALVGAQNAGGDRDGRGGGRGDGDGKGGRRGGGTLDIGETCTENRQCRSSCCDYPRKGGRGGSDSDSSMDSDDDGFRDWANNRILQAAVEA